MEINLVKIYRALLDDLGVDKKTSTYVLKRLQNEGHKFVTLILPMFSKHVLACIEQGKWSSFEYLGGFPLKEKGGLPLIFRGFLLELFTKDHNNCWVVRDMPDPVSLSVIRQVCEYVFKLSLPYDDSDVQKHTEAFIKADEETLAFGEYDESFVDAMRKNFETFYPQAARISPRDCALKARAGPGTFSGCDRKFYRRKIEQPSIRPEFYDYAFGLRFNRRAPMPRFDCSDPYYSEVLFVPKDSRGPRVIVREPYSNLLFQMGFNHLLSEALEADTRHRINFASQDINKSLACESSISRKYATLDLKEASDRVSYSIVRHIFRYCSILKFIELFRTKKAVLPDGRTIQLRKLSGMGSGFTFPTMALIIHLAICTQVSKALKRPYQHVSKHVYVYGDDIIVPTLWYDHAADALRKVGLVVNLSKSYRHSVFRESCGGDYLYGNDVTPVKLRLAGANPVVNNNKITPASGSYTDMDRFSYAIATHARELSKAMLFGAAEYLYRQLEQRFGPLPVIQSEIGAIARYSDNLDYHTKTDEYGHYPKVNCWVAIPKKESVPVPRSRTEDDLKGPCPYQYLRSTIGKVAVSKPFLDIESSVPLGFANVAIPRKLKLRKRRKNSLAFYAL